MTVRAGHAVAVRNKIRVLLKICRFVLGVVIGGIAITFRQDTTIIILGLIVRREGCNDYSYVLLNMSIGQSFEEKK